MTKTTDMSTLVPVILSGGSGTRLWPLSREHYPKQLLALVGDLTLLQQTACRLDGMHSIAPPLVVCNEEHRFLVAEQLRRASRPAGEILLEPVGRNTAPALTLAAQKLKARGGGTLMLVMPADHVIADRESFQRAVQKGLSYAEMGRLVTFGVKPTSPDTGYGYIRTGKAPSDAFDENAAYSVDAFVEKPNIDRAQEYLESGNYLWNSGIFLMKVDSWLSELKRYRPEIAETCELALRDGVEDIDFFRVNRERFLACPSDSIDYAVMEKTNQAMVVPLTAGWSDVGSWSSLWEVSDKDSYGNTIHGDVKALGTTNSLLHSESRLLATVAIENMIVVETADAVLVAPRDHAQEIKHLVDQLRQDGRKETQSHRRVYRPWGHYETMDSGDRFQVKRITVSPGAALSLQLHHHRAEHWVVVKGRAQVTRGEEVFELTENQSTYIPIGTKHRLENPGVEPLEMIEVQSGGYLGEDDIVRFEDLYRRN